MQQFCTYGSVRGAVSNGRPYRDKSASRAKNAAKPPAPPRHFKHLRDQVGQAVPPGGSACLGSFNKLPEPAATGGNRATRSAAIPASE